MKFKRRALVFSFTNKIRGLEIVEDKLEVEYNYCIVILV